MRLFDYLHALNHRSPSSSSLLPANREKAEMACSDVRILLLGLDSAGKTSLLLRLCDEDLGDVHPTTGFQVKTAAQDGLCVALWDVSGQRPIRPYWSHYLEGVDAIIFVIDAADRRRFEEASEELRLLLNNPKLEGVPFLVFANKQDLLHALSAKEIAHGLALSSYQQQRALRVFPCSATLATGLEDGMEFVMKEIRANRAIQRKCI